MFTRDKKRVVELTDAGRHTAQLICQLTENDAVEKATTGHLRGHNKGTLILTCVASRAFGSDQGLVGSMDCFREIF